MGSIPWVAASGIYRRVNFISFFQILYLKAENNWKLGLVDCRYQYKRTLIQFLVLLVDHGLVFQWMCMVRVIKRNTFFPIFFMDKITVRQLVYIFRESHIFSLLLLLFFVVVAVMLWMPLDSKDTVVEECCYPMSILLKNFSTMRHWKSDLPQC